MTRKIEPANVEELYQAHMRGETVDSIRLRLGVTAKVVVRWFRQAGHVPRTSKQAREQMRGFTDAEIPALYARYVAGESSVDIARSVGCHSAVLRLVFRRAGLAIRSESDAHRTEASRRTATERAARAAAAHDACRGKRQSRGHREKIAVTKERLLSHVGPEEKRVIALLRSRGISAAPQRAFGPYNVDVLAGETVAVEIFGGHWHATGRHLARHSKRVRYLLDAGLHLVVIWIDGAHGDRWIRGLDEVVALTELARGDPAARRQYRVVWCDGEVVTRLDDQAHDFPAKPPFEVRRNASGRYERAR